MTSLLELKLGVHMVCSSAEACMHHLAPLTHLDLVYAPPLHFSGQGALGSQLPFVMALKHLLFNINGDPSAQLSRSLSQLTRMTFLAIRLPHATAKSGFQHLAESLAKLSRLVHLEIKCMLSGDRSAYAFGSSLARLT
jgi:hypothetical protein